MRISAQSLFSLILTLIVVFMILLSLSYNENARFFPLLFGSLTVVLLFFQTLSDCFAKMEKKLSFVEHESVFSDFTASPKKNAPDTDEDKKGKVPLFKVFRLFLWLIILTFALRFYNYIAVVSIFIFLVIAVEAKAGWFRAFAVAVCAGLFIFLLFGVILRVNFQA